MTSVAISTSRRIGQFIRLLGSDQPGEVSAAAHAPNRTLISAGLDLYKLADAVETQLSSDKPAPYGEPVVVVNRPKVNLSIKRLLLAARQVRALVGAPFFQVASLGFCLSSLADMPNGRPPKRTTAEQTQAPLYSPGVE